MGWASSCPSWDTALPISKPDDATSITITNEPYQNLVITLMLNLLLQRSFEHTYLTQKAATSANGVAIGIQLCSLLRDSRSVGRRKTFLGSVETHSVDWEWNTTPNQPLKTGWAWGNASGMGRRQR